MGLTPKNSLCRALTDRQCHTPAVTQPQPYPCSRKATPAQAKVAIWAATPAPSQAGANKNPVPAVVYTPPFLKKNLLPGGAIPTVMSAVTVHKRSVLCCGWYILFVLIPLKETGFTVLLYRSRQLGHSPPGNRFFY